MEIKSIKRVLVVFMLVLVILTISFSLLNWFKPVLIGLQKTPTGIIEYFRDQSDSSFVIRPYFNGNPVSATVFVLINQPYNVVFLGKYVGYSLQIPFQSILEYVKPWENWRSNVNSSILVFVTYSRGNETFITPMEIPYNPSWVLNDKPISVVAKVNIIPKVINAEIKQQLGETQQKLLKTKPVYSHDEKTYIIHSVIKTLYESSSEVINVMCFYNFSVPLSWITISNNVNKYDNYTLISLFTALGGKVSWYAISALPPYYIGSSYSANINSCVLVESCPSFLSKLDNPTLYTYYNATIAVITYKSLVGNPISDSIVEILSVGKNIGGSIETSNGITCVIYNNLNSSEEYLQLQIGNGTVNYYQIIPYLTTSISFVKYGYAYWNKSNIYTTGKIHKSNELIYFFSGYIETNITSYNVSFINYVLPTIQTIRENYFITTHVSIILPSNSLGKIYVSFSNSTTKVGLPLLGFIMNYSSYYIT
ncbi:hypothetical protein [Sulfurisphaera ohwakuensis]|uniref:hypothetical protein n=1 Tax=Sulfurisphaera ohwakuensis TaxID=69656 RepID=UPI0036F25B9A